MKKLRKMLCTMMCAGGEAQSVWDGSANIGWYINALDYDGNGTAENPYRIANGAELAGLAVLVNAGGNADVTYDDDYNITSGGDYTVRGSSFNGAYIIQTEDIYLNECIHCYSDWGEYPPANSWTEIGTSALLGFRGNFAGKSIYGLYQDDGGYRGLFGYISTNGNVHDVRISNAYITSSSTIGGICGYLGIGTINKCCVEKARLIGAGNHAGGIVGIAAGTITNCYSGAYITSARYAGGIAAYLNQTAKCCYNYGEIDSQVITRGGVIGSAASGSTTEHLYYLDTCVSGGNSIGEAKTNEYMLSEDFILSLTDGVCEFEYNQTNLNCGYPLIMEEA